LICTGYVYELHWVTVPVTIEHTSEQAMGGNITVVGSREQFDTSGSVGILVGATDTERLSSGKDDCVTATESVCRLCWHLVSW